MMTEHEFDKLAARRQRHRIDEIEEEIERDDYDEIFHSSDDESRDNEP